MSSLRIITIAFVVALASAVAAQTQQTYTVYNWPDDLAKLPCDAFVKQADGSWKQVAIIKLPNGDTMEENNFRGGTRGGTEGEMIERKCGNKK